MKNNKTAKLTIGLILTVIIVMFLYYLVNSPQYKKEQDDQIKNIPPAQQVNTEKQDESQTNSNQSLSLNNDQFSLDRALENDARGLTPTTEVVFQANNNLLQKSQEMIINLDKLVEFNSQLISSLNTEIRAGITKKIDLKDTVLTAINSSLIKDGTNYQIKVIASSIYPNQNDYFFMISFKVENGQKVVDLTVDQL